MENVDWLEDSASKAMDALLARLDLSQGARPYFWVDFEASPPVAQHSYWDLCDISGRFVDGLALARIVTGRQDAQAEEAQLRRYLFAQQGEDGLFYNAEAASDSEMSKYVPDAGAAQAPRHVDLFCQRAPLMALTTLLQLGEPEALPRARRLVAGLLRLAERRGDEYVFPSYRWAPVMKPEWTHPVNVPEKWLGYRYALLTPLARYAELTLDAQARELALGLARHYLRHGDVPADGRYRANTHSGGVLPVAAGVARLGLAFDQPELVAWAGRVFDWTCENSTDFGFLPDGLGLEGFWSGTCETCALADFVHLALLLGRSGDPKYAHAVERLARNQLNENQYRDAAAIERTFPGIAPDVLRMLLGGFECAAFPNDLLSHTGAEACCIGGGLRALYLTWRSALESDDAVARVHHAITRADGRVSVTAHEPWQGLVEVRAHASLEVRVRLPEGVAESQVELTVDGRPSLRSVIDGYARFAAVEAGQTARLLYPLAPSERLAVVAGKTYRTRWLGNTVVAIDPPGRKHPIYRREALTPKAPAPRPSGRAYPSTVYW